MIFILFHLLLGEEKQRKLIRRDFVSELLWHAAWNLEDMYLILPETESK